MPMEDQLAMILVNYGLAGVVIYIFYMLFRNELHELKETIEKLSEKVDELSNKIEKLTALIEKGDKK